MNELTTCPPGCVKLAHDLEYEMKRAGFESWVLCGVSSIKKLGEVEAERDALRAAVAAALSALAETREQLRNETNHADQYCKDNVELITECETLKTKLTKLETEAAWCFEMPDRLEG